MYKKYKGIDSREIVCSRDSSKSIEAGISFDTDGEEIILRFHYLDYVEPPFCKCQSSVLCEKTKSMYLNKESIKQLVDKLQVLAGEKRLDVGCRFTYKDAQGKMGDDIVYISEVDNELAIAAFEKKHPGIVWREFSFL